MKPWRLISAACTVGFFLVCDGPWWQRIACYLLGCWAALFYWKDQPSPVQRFQP